MAATSNAGSSNTTRINTFMVNFSEPAKKPKVETVTDLIFNKIKLPSERIKSFQFNGSRGITYVECDSLEYALEVVENHDRKHEVEYDNVKFTVPLLMDDGATVVRVHDLPPQLDNDFIKREMEIYGEILSIKSEVWEAPEQLRGIPSGVRKMRIRLATTIPSYIFMAGHSTLVTYKNQQITCRHCGRQVHYGAKCAEAIQIVGTQKSVNTRMQRASSGYADILQGSSSTLKPPKRPATTDRIEPKMVNLNALNRKLTQEKDNLKSTITTTESATTTAADLVAQHSSDFVTPNKVVRVSSIIGGSDGFGKPTEGVNDNQTSMQKSNVFEALMDPNDISDYETDCSMKSTSSSRRETKKKGRKVR